MMTHSFPLKRTKLTYFIHLKENSLCPIKRKNKKYSKPKINNNSHQLGGVSIEIHLSNTI